MNISNLISKVINNKITLKLKNPFVAAVVGFIFIIYTFNNLISKGYNIWSSIKIIAFFFLLYISLIILMILLMNKGKEIDLTKMKTEKEIKEKEIEYKRLEIEENLLKEINPDLGRFFDILDKKGVLKIGELDIELLKQSEKVIFIIESGEGTSRIIGSKNDIYFTRFMERKFKKEIGDKAEIYNINKIISSKNKIIPGASSFIIFCNDKEEDICSNIEKLYNKIYEGYSKFIHVEVEKDLNNMLKNKKKQKNYEELKEWYEKYRKALNNGLKPLILITEPYRISLFSLLKMLLSYDSKNDDNKKNKKSIENKIPNILEQKINNIINQKINKFVIKFSYLFGAVEFDPETIKRFEELESSIVEELKNHYGIKSDNYFSELLKKEDFLDEFEKLLKGKEDFYNKIKKDVRYERLIELIKYIQTKIFGVHLRNISI